jgi:hypothetical protein
VIRRSVRARAQKGERGAALILAIGFMIAVGAICAGLLGLITTSVGARPQLDKVRNRQYAADAAIESAIANVRSLPAPGETPCANALTTQNAGPFTLNGVAIRVSCQDALDYVLGTGVILLQRNVIFSACDASAFPCTATNAIIRAQVNYESIPGSPLLLTHTYIQSWSVVQ